MEDLQYSCNADIAPLGHQKSTLDESLNTEKLLGPLPKAASSPIMPESKTLLQRVKAGSIDKVSMQVNHDYSVADNAI
jgi:hypothetical protein